MTRPFDPYHKWLGISPKEQPPTHYRLLGIELFEGDPDVIEAAADQRMAHVRTYQTGQNSELSQKILNELSAAKLCLLNDEKKVAYDAELRRRMSAATIVARPAATNVVASTPHRIETAPAISIRTEPRRRRSNNSKAAITFAAALVAILSVVGLWYVNSGTHVPQRAGAAHDSRDSTPRSVAVRSDANGSLPLQPSPTATAAKKSGGSRSGTAGENVPDDDLRAPSAFEQSPAADKSDRSRDTAAEKINDDQHELPTTVKDDTSRGPSSPAKQVPKDMPSGDTPETKPRSQNSHESVASSADAERELPAFHPKGNWLDALKVIDPLEHLVQGDWVRGRKDIQAIAGASAAITEIPIEAEGSYDLQVQFTRLRGDGALAIVFPVGADRGQFWLSSAGDKAGLLLAEGAKASDAESETPVVLSNNHRYALELQVRVLDNDFVAVEVLIDKKKLSSWRGSPAKLLVAAQPLVTPGIRFGILSGPATSAVVHALRVRAMSAESALQSRISLRPKGSVVKLRIAGRIDGRDRCQIGADSARWTHETWSWPTKVKLCGAEWSPQKQPSMPVEPRLRNALAKADFGSAQLAKISGRGEIRLERSADSLVIVLDDDAAGFGADDYEAVVTLLRDK